MHGAASREPDLHVDEEPVSRFQASYMIGRQGRKLQQYTVLANIDDDAPAEAGGMPELLRLGGLHDAQHAWQAWGCARSARLSC